VRARAGLTALLLLLFPAASPAASGDVYRLSWRREIPIVAMSAATLAASRLAVDGIGRDPCPCESDGLSALDRGIAGPKNSAAATASDLAADVALAAPFVIDALDVRARGAGWDGFGADAAVMLEALAVNEGLDQLVKAATRRPRPLLYGLPAGSPEMAAVDNYRSFYSGHASGTFAVGMAYARTYALRHPTSGARWAVYGAAALAGAVVSGLRVAAHEHFPTDVLAGAVAGTAVGLLVPALHRPRALAAASLAPLSGGLAVRVTLPLH
jgi:membrane-associated phospholipid phosphatase